MRNTISADLTESGPAAENAELQEMLDQNEELRIAQEQANEYSEKLENWVSHFVANFYLFFFDFFIHFFHFF